MKKLILIRHAKSSWKHDVIDHERPLNSRGVKDVELMSNHLKEKGLQVDLVLSSDAVRAKTTANGIISNLNIDFKNLHFIEPLGYLEFNFLVKNSLCVITDSGEITEETTYMKVPCLTLRDNTERPETITLGTNSLVGTNPKNINKSLSEIFAGDWKKGEIPKFWDGKTSERIIEHILTLDK